MDVATYKRAVDGTAAQEVTETTLLKRVARRDMAAFEDLYRLYHSRVYRFAYRTLHRPDLVEEVVNDTLWVVWNKADTFTGHSRVSTWIFGIAYRKSLKALDRWPDSGDGEIPIEDVENVLPGPGLREFKQIELDDWLDKALARLPPEQRAVLELTYREGLDYQDIAGILGCPENTVKTRMFHARRKLQPLLSDLTEAPGRSRRK